jgi:hypothetical protein
MRRHALGLNGLTVLGQMTLYGQPLPASPHSPKRMCSGQRWRYPDRDQNEKTIVHREPFSETG